MGDFLRCGIAGLRAGLAAGRLAGSGFSPDGSVGRLRSLLSTFWRTSAASGFSQPFWPLDSHPCWVLRAMLPSLSANTLFAFPAAGRVFFNCPAACARSALRARFSGRL